MTVFYLRLKFIKGTAVLKKLSVILFLLLLLSCYTKEKNKASRQRIISLAPNITEILYALDLGEQLVGVSEFCTFPPEAKEKENIGALFNPNMEKIITLKPDLILATESNTRLHEKLADKNIKVVLLPERTVADVFTSIDSIAALTGKKAQAKKLISAIKDSLAVYKEEAGNQKPLAILVLGRDENSTRNIGISGPGAFINELWEFAGGLNAFPDMPGSYTQVNREDLLVRNPQVIIEFKTTGKWDFNRQETNKSEWQDLEISAVKNGNIFIISGVTNLVPGVRIYLLAKEYRNILKMYRK